MAVVTNDPRWNRRTSMRAKWLLACGLVMTLLLVLRPHSAIAESSKDKAKAQRFFKKGNKAFTAGRYEDALASYRKSFELVEHPRTLFNVAMCEDRLGREEAAYVAFRAFLEVAQERDAKHKVIAEDRLAELSKTMRLMVTITSRPEGASVFVNGSERLAGRTAPNLELSIGLGSHSFRFEADNHATKTIEFTVEAGSPRNLDVSLEPRCRLTITTEPSDAVIVRKDEPTTKSKGHYSEVLKPGAYKFTVSRDGYLPRETLVDAVGGEAVTRHIVLSKEAVALPVPTIVLPPRDDRPSPGRGLRYGGLATMSGGVLALALGVKFGLDSQSFSNDAHDVADRTGIWDDDTIGLIDDANQAQRNMYISYGVATVALGTGAVLYYLGAKKKHRPERARAKVSSTIAPTPGGACLQIWGDF